MKRTVLFLAALALFSCKKDPITIEPVPVVSNYTPPPSDTGEIRLNFTNHADNIILQLSKDTAYTSLTPKYINANGDTFSVTRFRYYISNIRFKKADGSYYAENESYHLLDLADTTNNCKFNVKKVPYGKYIAVEYLVGIDSLRNCSGAQNGVLAATSDMFWSWNQGYIFLKFEGYSSSGPVNNIHNLEYHVGGFKLPYNNIKKITLPFSDTLRVGTNIPKLYLKANIQDMFRNTAGNINFATQQVLASPSSARVLASNYASMFTISAVVN